MNILEIENFKQELLKNLSLSISNRAKAVLITDYLIMLLNAENQNFIKPYLLEVLDEYVSSIAEFDPEGIDFQTSHKIVENLHETIVFLKAEAKFIKEIDSLENIYSELSGKFNQLELILNGKSISQPGRNFIFPLIEQIDNEKESVAGIIETVTIKISPATENKFIIVPSEKEIENNIRDQVEHSWEAAKKFIKKFTNKKTGAFHVIIQFDKRIGFYHGNSLGVALTLNFIRSILEYLNSSYIINPAGNAAFTGGMNLQGEIIPTTESFIRQKVEVIFFSFINLLIISKENEAAASDKLDELLKRYPDRKLKIIGIEDFDDLLNRRNIIEIKKQNPAKRTINYMKKNPLVVILFMIMLAAFVIYSSVVWDTNPDNYAVNGRTLSVKNSLGQILWTCTLEFSMDTPLERDKLNKCCRIIDIDNDGINEVLIAYELLPENESGSNYGKVTCYNYQEEIIWSYVFKDSVSTVSKNHTRNYISGIIDTLTINNRKQLFLIANNNPLYPNAVYRLDLVTGKRTDSINTLWNSGAITSAIIGDFNDDGKIELTATGGNNGYERAVFFNINIDQIKNCQMPATGYYKLNNIEKANYNEYVILPQTDFSYYHKNRYNIGQRIFFRKDTGQFEIWVIENINNPFEAGNMLYFFNKDLKLSEIDCGDDFTFLRDDLIRKGKLKPPYTNTSEFYNLLKKEVKYLKRNEMIVNE